MPTIDAVKAMPEIAGNAHFIDSHCHLDAVDDLNSRLASARAQGIDQFIVPGIESVQWQRVTELRASGVFYALGTHPWYVHNPQAEAALLASAIERYSPVAVGEIGLDFYRGKAARPEKNLQLESLERQLDIASQNGLPVILHSVKAHNELLEMLKRFPQVRGVVHAFSGSAQIAEQYTELGYFFGAGPLIVQSAKLQRVFQQLPLNRIVLETDAPFMANKTAAEANPLLAIHEVAKKLASVKSATIEQLAQASRHNTQALFNLP